LNLLAIRDFGLRVASLREIHRVAHVLRRLGGLTVAFVAVVFLAGQGSVWADSISTLPTASYPYLFGAYVDFPVTNTVSANAESFTLNVNTGYDIADTVGDPLSYGSIAIAGTLVGGTLSVTGEVGTRGSDFPTFTPYDSLSGNLLGGTIVATQQVLATDSQPEVDYYLIDVYAGTPGGKLAGWFGPEVLARVSPGADYIKIQPVVPEPTAMMAWAFLGPAGIMLGIRAWRRRGSKG
jgi:hypothetical protein